MEYMIELNEGTKRFGSKVAVDHLSLAVQEGECFGLLGHNGAGKSTTIDCILGLKKMEEGESRILGLNPIQHRKNVFEQVGVQLQSSAFQQNIRVAEVCEEISCLYQHPQDYRTLLEQFGLAELKHQLVERLSGGEKQKLSVLLTLIPNPKVIFLDEITTGLDTAARRDVLKLLKKLKAEKTTIFLVSHNLDEVEQLCNRVLILKHGRQLISGTVQEVIAASGKADLEEAYLWYIEEEER